MTQVGVVVISWLVCVACGQHYQIETSPHLTSPRTVQPILEINKLVENEVERSTTEPRRRRGESVLSYGVYPLVLDDDGTKGGPILGYGSGSSPFGGGMIDHGGGIYSFSYMAGDGARRKGPPKGKLTSFYYIMAPQVEYGQPWIGTDQKSYGTPVIDDFGTRSDSIGGYPIGPPRYEPTDDGRVNVQGDYGYAKVDDGSYVTGVQDYGPRVDGYVTNAGDYGTRVRGYQPRVVTPLSSERPRLSNGPQRPIHLSPVTPQSSTRPPPFSKPVFLPNLEEDHTVCSYPHCLAVPGQVARPIYHQSPEVQYRVTKRDYAAKYSAKVPPAVVVTTPSSRLVTAETSAPRILNHRTLSQTISPEIVSPGTISPWKVSPRTVSSTTISPRRETPKASHKIPPRTIYPRVVSRKSSTEESTPRTGYYPRTISRSISTATPRVITPRAITPRTFTSRTVTSKSSSVSYKSLSRGSSRDKVNDLVVSGSSTLPTSTVKVPTTSRPKSVTAKAVLLDKSPPSSHTMKIQPPPKKHVQKIPPPKNSNITSSSPSKNTLHSFTILARNGLNKNIHAKDEDFYISSGNSH